MRRVLACLLTIVVLDVVGCPGRQPPGTTPAGTPPAGPAASSGAKTGAPSAPEHAKAPGRAGAGPCDPSQFAPDGYEVMTSHNADLDGDGRDECLIGCQYTQTDELGDPKEPAYFTVAQEGDEGWAEWLSIPAPRGETFVDDQSIVAAEDLNGDGAADLLLRFYTFGVSGRGEPLYVWRVTKGGLELEIKGGCAELSSQDGFRLADVDESCPGPELVLAFCRIEDEPNAAPHRYEIEAWGWQDGKYDYVSGGSSTTLYDDPDSALEAFVSGADYR